MQFGLAFSYQFQDQDWMKKIGLVALLSLIPIVGPLVLLGWVIEITRRVIVSEQPTLPEALDFSGWLKKGLMVFVISFVYAIPVIVVAVCMQTANFLPIIFGSLDVDESVMTTLLTMGTVVSLCCGCLLALLGLAVGFISPAAYATYAATGELGAAFRFGEVFSLIKAAPSAYLIVLLGTIAQSFIAAVGLLLCCIGVVATAAYGNSIAAHLWAQAYLVAKEKKAAIQAV